MANTNYIIFSSVFLLSLIASGTAISCYICVSHPILPDENCLKGKTSKMSYNQCPSGMEFCSITRIETPGTFLSAAGYTVTRSCSAIDKAPVISGINLPGEYKYCKGDYCNNGHRYYLPLGTLILSLMVAFTGM